MLKRLYINNYKCLVNFELSLAQTTLLVGLNGTGKSTIFDLLEQLRGFIAGTSVEESFPTRSLTSWQSSGLQRPELTVSGGPNRMPEDYVLPLIFTRRLCDVFNDEPNHLAAKVDSRQKTFQFAGADHKLVRFYLPLIPDDPEQPVWYVIRELSDKIAEGITYMRSITRENPPLRGTIDRVNCNATTKEQEEIVAALATTERKIEEETVKQVRFRDLFRSLLHELMTPKTRVNSLSLS